MFFKIFVLRIYQLKEKEGQDLIEGMYVQNNKYRNNL